jgi:3-methylfumaryl-CoA hydratase
MTISTDSNLDTDHLRSWIGKSQTEHDTVTAAPLRMMRATLDLPQTDASKDLPPLWHWLYFLPSPQQSELGDDGHAKRGGFLPPVPLPRRMWAAGSFKFFHDLGLGDEITRTSTIDDVTVKTGRTGSLCFVRVRHEVSNRRSGQDLGLALREFHDIVYRPLAALDAKAATYEAAPSAAYSEVITPTDPLLFRYSALTFNGHRIHYDRKYVTEVEGYPGLIVHGPLMATLLAGLGKKLHPDARIDSFEFRALKPVFDLHPFEICAGKLKDGVLDLWVKDFEGHVTMKATMHFDKLSANGVWDADRSST